MQIELTAGEVQYARADGAAPAHFLVTHVISWAQSLGAAGTDNRISLTQLVPADSRDAPYAQVEAAAAHHLSDLLRQLADAVDRENRQAAQREDDPA